MPWIHQHREFTPDKSKRQYLSRGVDYACWLEGGGSGWVVDSCISGTDSRIGNFILQMTMITRSALLRSCRGLSGEKWLDISIEWYSLNSRTLSCFCEERKQSRVRNSHRPSTTIPIDPTHHDQDDALTGSNPTASEYVKFC